MSVPLDSFQFEYNFESMYDVAMRNDKLVRNHLFLDEAHYTFTSASILYSALKSIKIKTNFHLLYYSNRFCRRPRGSWLDATFYTVIAVAIYHTYIEM